MDAKIERLKANLAGLDGVLVAFSAGVDSTFLLKIAHAVLGDKAIALTATSPTVPPGELDAAKTFAQSLGCRHLIIDSHEMENPSFSKNPANRCFFCKDELYSICQNEARRLGRPARAIRLRAPRSRRGGGRPQVPANGNEC